MMVVCHSEEGGFLLVSTADGGAELAAYDWGDGEAVLSKIVEVIGRVVHGVRFWIWWDGPKQGGVGYLALVPPADLARGQLEAFGAYVMRLVEVARHDGDGDVIFEPLPVEVSEEARQAAGLARENPGVSDRDRVLQSRPTWLWCLHCERAYPARHFREKGTLQLCGYFDCDGDAVGDAWEWSRWICQGFDVPIVPEVGVVYPMVSRQHAPVFWRAAPAGRRRR